jgi:hypothetical protein
MYFKFWSRLILSLCQVGKPLQINRPSGCLLLLTLVILLSFVNFNPQKRVFFRSMFFEWRAAISHLLSTFIQAWQVGCYYECSPCYRATHASTQ